jgi:LysR family hydrogen peroxide-inducible transcriptional activator
MSELTLRQLQYAVAVADQGHFGRAAEVALVSQPGLSAQVRELERSLGVDLFERTSRGTRTTPAGEALIHCARQVLLTVADLQREAQLHREGLRGTVRVAAIPTMAPYLLPGLVRVLHTCWPQVQLQLLELQTSRLVEAIEDGSVDLGLLATPVDTGSLHVHALCKEDFVLAVPRRHRLAKGGPLPLSVLRDLPVLLMEDGHCLHEHAQAACALAGQPEVTVVRSAGLSTLAQMVVAGAGVTLLPESAVPVEARAGSGLAVRRFEPPAPGRTVSLAWRGSDPRRDVFAPAAAEAARVFSPEPAD